MKFKKVAGILFLMLFVFSFVSAITGSIGNARMILRVNQGDVIEKYILVKNVNDVAIDVELSVSGDLEENVELIDSSFRLEPGTEKKAYFKIEAAKSGTSETDINVKFTPIDGGNGVGLSSKVIVVAGNDDGSYLGGDENNDQGDSEEGDIVLGDNDGDMKGENKSTIYIMAIVLVALFAIFLMILRKTKFEKEVHRK